MKPIREILDDRRLSLFGAPHEKGSREWRAFDVVREDKVDTFRVAVPRRPIVLREPRHVLRILYPRARNAY